MAITRGTKASGGTDFVSGFTILADEVNTDLNTAYSGINNVTISDANVAVAANIDPSKIGDFAANDGEYQTTSAPAARADGTDYTIVTTSLPTDMEGEIGRLRYPWKEAFGWVINTAGNLVAAQWYSMFGKGVMVATGFMQPTLLAAAPSGWILADDGTIGDGSSGATTRAHKDTRELYNLLWNKYADAICPVTGGRGATSTADFDAHKPMALPPICGRAIGVAGTARATNHTESITGTQGTRGTTTAGGSTVLAVIQAVLASVTTDDYNGFQLKMLSGADSGVNRTISSYAPTTGNLGVAAFGSATGAGNTYVIYAGDNTHFILDYETAPNEDDALNGFTLELTGGTGSGQSQVITDYDGSNRVITVGSNWSPVPDDTTTYAIYKSLSTRAVAAQVGTEVIFPSTRTYSQAGVTSVVSAATGKTRSQMQPTFFATWIIKL